MAVGPHALAPRATRRPPSAALILGTLSGVLAGFMYMAISVPLVLVTVRQEERNAAAAARTSVDEVWRWVERGEVVTPQRLTQLGLDWAYIEVRDTGSPLVTWGTGDVRSLGREACASDEPTARDRDGSRYAVACLRTPTHRIAAGVAPSYQVGSQILYFTLALAVIVGLMTALMHTRLLSPLSEMSRALERIGRGERHVQVARTGLAELDVMADRINEAAEQLEEQVDAITARIAVVQEMARMVAHEVRNPLQSLELLTTLIAAEDEAAERAQLAEAIHREVRALDQVVQRLLTEGAAQGALRLRTRRQPIGEIVAQVCQLHQARAARRGVRLSVGVVAEDAAAVDSAMLGRSVENLVNNALRAVLDHTGEVRVSVYRDGDWLKIAVDDNGPGVPPELGDRIFDREVTTREEGHGLGLALAKAVLLAHGGHIEYTDSPLGGARFVASLPVDPPEDGHA